MPRKYQRTRDVAVRVQFFTDGSDEPVFDEMIDKGQHIAALNVAIGRAKIADVEGLRARTAVVDGTGMPVSDRNPAKSWTCKSMPTWTEA